MKIFLLFLLLFPLEYVHPQRKTELLNYKIGIGDILSILVTPTEELSRDVVVNPDGTITFPFIGIIPVEGITVRRLKEILETKLSKYVTEPKISISMKRLTKSQIILIGEVNSPGAYPYREGLKLLELITLASGFTEKAKKREIKIHRGKIGNKKIMVFNVAEVINSGDLSKDLPLEPGDIVEVPTEYKNVSVIGAVVRGGFFGWKEDLRILEAISYAEGPTPDANLKSVIVIRKTSGGQKLIKVNVKKALKGDLSKNILIEPGDVIYLPRTSLTLGTMFISKILPWLSLISLILVIKGGLGI